MTIKKELPLNMSTPCSIKTRFTIKFLTALKKLNKNRPISPSSVREKYRRYHKVKIASYASMASAVGSRRRWSRVMLRKIKYNRGLVSHGLIKRSHRCVLKRRKLGENPKRKEFGDDDDDADQLRKLIPGGEEMDSCSLLDETAHYIQCLTMQVQIMRNILNVCSN